MRLIDADALKADLRQYFTDGVLDGISARLAFNQILHDTDNAPTVEYPEQIIINCDTEEEKQKLLSALRNARLTIREDAENETDYQFDVINRNLKARPQGEWIKISPANIYECSECHQVVMTSDIKCYLYCHQCGTEMRVKDELNRVKNELEEADNAEGCE